MFNLKGRCLFSQIPQPLKSRVVNSMKQYIVYLASPATSLTIHNINFVNISDKYFYWTCYVLMLPCCFKSNCCTFYIADKSIVIHDSVLEPKPNPVSAKICVRDTCCGFYVIRVYFHWFLSNLIWIKTWKDGSLNSKYWFVWVTYPGRKIKWRYYKQRDNAYFLVFLFNRDFFFFFLLPYRSGLEPWLITDQITIRLTSPEVNLLLQIAGNRWWIDNEGQYCGTLNKLESR